MNDKHGHPALALSPGTQTLKDFVVEVVNLGEHRQHDAMTKIASWLHSRCPELTAAEIKMVLFVAAGFFETRGNGRALVETARRRNGDIQEAHHRAHVRSIAEHSRQLWKR